MLCLINVCLIVYWLLDVDVDMDNLFSLGLDLRWVLLFCYLTLVKIILCYLFHFLGLVFDDN